MEQFSLDKWLKDKSRKVVTRDGRSVRIICTDAKLDIRNTKGKQIIALVPRENKTEIILEFYSDGTFYRTEESYFDLFFADEEEELTEFESKLADLLVYNHPMDIKSAESIAKRKSKILLDLARKELEKDYCIMEPFDVSDLKKEQRELGEAIGRTNALKDMPKWKKITEKEQKYLAYGFLSWDDYYLSIQELKDKLQKEE